MAEVMIDRINVLQLAALTQKPRHLLAVRIGPNFDTATIAASPMLEPVPDPVYILFHHQAAGTSAFSLAGSGTSPVPPH
jgi:hypothetical protein